MSSLFNAVLQTLKDRLPNTSWKVGSLVRELLVEPLMLIGKSVDDKLAEIINTENISAAISDPINNENTLNVWMDRLRISTPEPQRARGTVYVTFTGSEVLTIATGTIFTWGEDIQIRSTKFVSIDPLKPSDMLQSLAGGFYVVEIPVETVDAAAYTLASGAKLNWTAAPNRISDICVNIPISGGTEVLTAAEKARLITAKLESSNMCGEGSILNALVNEFGSTICDVRLENRVRTGDVIHIPMYIKQALPTTRIKVTLSAKEPGVYVGTVDQIVSVESIKSTDGWPRQFAVEYRPGDVIEVSIDGERAETVTAEVAVFEQSARIESWINSRQRGVVIPLKVTTPAYCELSIDIPETATIPIGALSDISAHINNSGFSATVTDKDINTILNKYGIRPSRSNTYTAIIKYHSFSRKVVQTGGISLDGIPGLGTVPVAIYCPANKIRTV